MQHCWLSDLSVSISSLGLMLPEAEMEPKGKKKPKLMVSLSPWLSPHLIKSADFLGWGKVCKEMKIWSKPPPIEPPSWNAQRLNRFFLFMSSQSFSVVQYLDFMVKGICTTGKPAGQHASLLAIERNIGKGIFLDV